MTLEKWPPVLSFDTVTLNVKAIIGLTLFILKFKFIFFLQIDRRVKVEEVFA